MKPWQHCTPKPTLYRLEVLTPAVSVKDLAEVNREISGILLAKMVSVRRIRVTWTDRYLNK